MELTDVLMYHAQQYPKMGPADAVKLVHQNEFGNTLYVCDAEESLSKIQSDLQGIQCDRNIPLTEPLGDGYVRVNLVAIKDHGITPEELNDMLVKSTRVSVRNTFSFRKKLQTLEEMHYEHPLFSFSSDDLKAYLYDYARRGYPYVSHSKEYTNTYHPAYRVIREEYLTSN